MVRVLAFLVCLCTATLAGAASVSTHVNPNGSITFTVNGEGIRSFEVWLPPGDATGGTPGAPTTGDGRTILTHWQPGTTNGPRGGGWVWNNPGDGGNVNPIGPDGGTFTITPNYNASPEGTFAGTWTTDDDGARGQPPHGGHFGPHITDHGAIVDGGGHIIPLPTKWVRLDFPTHPGDPDGPCACAIGGTIAGHVTVEGLDGSESPTWSIVASTSRRRSPIRDLDRPGSIMPRQWGDLIPDFGLDRLSPVPREWGFYSTPMRGEMNGGAADLTIGVRSTSHAHGRTIFVVIAVDIDSDGAADAWTLPAEIVIQ